MLSLMSQHVTARNQRSSPSVNFTGSARGLHSATRTSCHFYRRLFYVDLMLVCISSDCFALCGSFSPVLEVCGLLFLNLSFRSYADGKKGGESLFLSRAFASRTTSTRSGKRVKKERKPKSSSDTRKNNRLVGC